MYVCMFPYVVLFQVKHSSLVSLRFSYFENTPLVPANNVMLQSDIEQN